MNSCEEMLRTGQGNQKITHTHLREKEDCAPLFVLGQLALYNKVLKKFKITSESVNSNGERIVEIDLFLGDEIYHGSGTSIKKAKNNVAAEALQHTALPKKTPKKEKTFDPSSFTPTVQLNAFALSKGLQVTYELIQKSKLPDYSSINYGNRPSTNIHYQPVMYAFKVLVGDQSFIGFGTSQQKARHNAAADALKQLGISDVPTCNKQNLSIEKPPSKSTKEQNSAKEKSVIVQLYEKANAAKMTVSFNFKNPEGPAHMPQFSVIGQLIPKFCASSNKDSITVFGSGRTKHQAKTNAASDLLIKIQEMIDSYDTKIKCPALPQKLSEPAKALHPVSRLIQIMHAKKMKEPEFTVLSCDKDDRKWNYCIQCKLEDGKTSTGSGGSKKVAKQLASESMLEMLGFTSKPKQIAIKKNKSSNVTSLPTVLEEVTETV